MAAITASGISKTYVLPSRKGRKVALESLDLKVEPGEIYGFLGPNGAGKTTTIKILLGFIRPTSGEALIFDRPVEDAEARRSVGYLPEQPYFHKFLTPWEILRMHAALAGVPRRERQSACSDAIELVGLESHAKFPVSKLSKGLAQRIGIAQALVGSPRLLILDEPTSGLDPFGRRMVRDLLISLKESGTTIFLSSHLLSEIEHICDRIGILSSGRLAAEGTPSEIKAAEPITTLRTTELNPDAADALKALGAQWQIMDGEVDITMPGEAVFRAVRILEENGLPLISAEPRRETLEDAFLRLAA
jgi:ABC-2 type transport system ATP-binding protein